VWDFPLTFLNLSSVYTSIYLFRLYIVRKFTATVQELNRIAIPKEIVLLEKIKKGCIVEIEITVVK